MIHFAFKLLVSFLISNWIYSELCLSVPHFRSTSEMVYANVKIPTHDQWSAITDSAGSAQLDSTLRSTVASIAPNAQVFDSRTTSLWDQATRALHQIFSFNFRPAAPLPYLTGDSIFVKPDKQPFDFKIRDKR